MAAVPLTPHPDFLRFKRTMNRLVADKRYVSWQGDVYRLAHPKYASQADFISGAGAQINGARWNPPFGPPTLYVASSPVLAAEETFALARKFGFAPRTLLPRVIRAIHVRASRLVDTTDGDIRRSLMVSKQRMLGTDWRKANARGKEALTQAIGRAAAETGLEGLIVASAESSEEFNLVVFVDNLGGRSRVEVVS